MSTCSLFLRALLVSAIMILPASHHLYADPPRLDPPVVLPGGSVDLRLRGDSGSNYTIEASANLADWLAVFTGIAGANGLVTARHDAGPNRPTLFYRAREAASTLPALTVGPQLNTNITAGTLLTSAGGSTVLYGSGGTRFTFSLASNSVPEPRILKLTLVTNITGLPFASGMRGAVRIEPDDLAFWGPGTLEITFPPTIDRRYLASFFCNADGSSFQLTPDRVRTNTISITVTRPGIFGSSVITAQELADAAQREIGDSPVAAPTAAAHLRAAVVECPIGSEALAADMRRRLNAEQAASSKATAAALGASRRAQQAGATDDSSSALVDAADAICKFYDSHIYTKWGTAIQNCAVGKVVFEFALSANRQRQLLGADDCATIAEMPICIIFKKCLEEIRDCCENVTKEAKRVRAVLNMQRAQQLLRLDCITDDEAEFVIELCSTNAWTGTFVMQGNGATTNNVISGGGTTITTIDRYTARFDGWVEESTEEGTTSTGLNIVLKIAGQLNYNTLHSVETTAACSYSLRSVEAVAIGPTEYFVIIGIPPNGSGYSMLAYHVGIATLPVHGTVTSTDYVRGSICDPPEFESNKIALQPTVGLAQGTPMYQGTLTTITNIAGSLSVAEPTTPPTTFKFDWSFTRHGVPQ